MLDRPGLRDLLLQVAEGAGALWLDEGAGPRRVPGWRSTPEAVHRLATALIAVGGRHLDELRPCADVRIGDGIRVHAVLPPVAVGGAAVSVRVPRLERPSFSELVRRGLCGAAAASALLDLADPGERIITIEDLAELRLRHPHVVALEARPASAEGVGRVTLDELLREALRMRPDRIVLGECRGAELGTLFAALNTGHDGGAGTVHASRIAEVPARLEALGALAGLDRSALARQAVAAVDLVVHLSRAQGRPRISGAASLRIGQDGTLELGPPLGAQRPRARAAHAHAA